MKRLIVFIIGFISLTVNAKTMTVMSYNVENLFDTKHDEGKIDWTFLPSKTKGKKEHCKTIRSRRRKTECFETDWTEDKLEMKLNKIADVVLRDGRPEVLALVEVENENVVRKLAKLLKYKDVSVSNSPDKRGVDVALLYNSNEKFKFVAKKEHELKSEEFKAWPTRNILEVEFLVDGKFPMTFFVNHWPSLGNPTIKRIRAAESLRNRVLELVKKKHYVVGLGDFNTDVDEHPHPFRDVLLKDDLLIDLHEKYVRDRSISWNIKNQMPPGTYFFAPEMKWNVLDRIFLSSNFFRSKKGPSVKHTSYKIVSPSFLTDTYEYRSNKKYLHGSKVKGVPKRYDHATSSESKSGYSDHFPVQFKIKI